MANKRIRQGKLQTAKMVQDALADEFSAFRRAHEAGAEIEPGDLTIDFEALARARPVIVAARDAGGRRKFSAWPWKVLTWLRGKVEREAA